MTKTKEQEAVVRSIARRCRGPLVVDEATWRKHWTAWEAIEDKQDVQAALAFIEERWADARKLVSKMYRGLPKPPILAVKDLTSTPETWQTLRRAALPLIRLRAQTIGKGCGQDINDVICAGEFDGEEHAYKCPQCGNAGTYTAPIFDEEAA